MRKLFTLFAAALFATSMWADTTVTFSTADITTGTVKNHVTPITSYSAYSAKICTSSNVSLIQIGDAADASWQNNAKRIAFKVDPGEGIITAIKIHGSTNSSGSGSANGAVVFWNDTTFPAQAIGYVTPTFLNYVQTNSCDGHYINITPATGTKAFAIYKRVKMDSNTFVMNTGSNQGSSTTLRVDEVEITITPECAAPETALTLSSNAATEVYVGNEITFSTVGGNGGEITLAGTNSETITDSVWVATAGTHTFTASQAKNGDYCAQESELIINVAAANPVTEVTIAGESSAYVGDVLTYTATAANATAYEWYLDGAKQGSDSAKFIYTAVKGNHFIICKARNKFNKEAETETWVSSVAKALTVTSLSGTLISYEVNSDATGATNVSGLWVSRATNKVSLTKKNPVKLTVDGHEYTGYKMDKGKYVGVSLTSDSFLAGDTVAFLITCATNSAKLYLYDTESGTNRLDSIDGTNKTGWVSFILNQATTGVYLYRFNPDETPYNQNPYVAAVKVARPKEIASVDTALVNVKVNNVAISAANLTALLADKSLDLADEYLDAPVVKFFKKTTITYEDASKNYINDSAAITATVNGAGKWQAKYTVDEDTYTVTMAKTASFAVTYKLGSRTLGSENVLANGHPANFAQYQNQGNYATFQSWCSDAALENTVTIAEAVITKDTTFYGKFDFVYAESINIEQWILDNAADSASSVALIALLGTRHYASNISYIKGTNELDSLSTKDDRNEPYLGLKVKEAGKLLNFRLEKDTYVKIKFGAIKNEKPQVAINGGAYEEVDLTDGVYEYIATEADLVSIKTMSANAVVFKQIMINEPIADVTLPTSIENTADEVKAVKFFENGQMYIRRGEKVYTVTGAEVK